MHANQATRAQVAVFTVLQLPHPSPAQPYIKGLLDPCTNSMTTPNIPAEKLYDKKVGPIPTLEPRLLYGLTGGVPESEMALGLDTCASLVWRLRPCR